MKKILKEKTNRLLKTGNEAIAEGMRQIDPDVVACYPITPATEIVEIFSRLVANGQTHGEFIAAESEHSAISAAIGASAAGVRAMTATSSQGLALMHEMLFICSGLRLPIVMPVVNRALSAPINIHCDHSDSMAARDAGWIQLYAENNQEAYDNLIQAVKMCEHQDVRLPAMVMLDGFITSHSLEPIELLADQELRNFIGSYQPERRLLDFDRPYTVGALDLPDYYFEHKRQAAAGMANALKQIKKTAQEFAKFGRSYGLFEEYQTKDAEFIMVGIGSFCGTAKYAINRLRKKNIRAGLIKIRVFRPFPGQELARILARAKTVAVMERLEPMNNFGGPLFSEIRSALYEQEQRPKIHNFIYGLGGRDIFPEDIEKVFSDLKNGKIKQTVSYIGLRSHR